MALTPNSGSSPYLDPETFIIVRDASAIAALLLDGQDDSGTPQAPSSLASDPVVLICLEEASGEVEAACVRGKMYLPGDLLALNGNSRRYLQSIVASIAFQRLREKRGSELKPLPDYERALKNLESIEKGEQVFAFAEAEAAGLPATSAGMYPDPTRAGLVSHNHRFMPRRPPYGQGYGGPGCW